MCFDNAEELFDTEAIPRKKIKYEIIIDSSDEKRVMVQNKYLFQRIKLIFRKNKSQQAILNPRKESRQPNWNAISRNHNKRILHLAAMSIIDARVKKLKGNRDGIAKRRQQ